MKHYKSLSHLKSDLHYGKYRSKLVPFGALKFFFYIYKGPSLERFSPLCKHHLSLQFWCKKYIFAFSVAPST